MSKKGNNFRLNWFTHILARVHTHTNISILIKFAHVHSRNSTVHTHSSIITSNSEIVQNIGFRELFYISIFHAYD